MTKKYIIILGVCLVVLASFFLARPKPVTVESESRVVMGTFGRMMVVAADEKTAAACIEAGFKSLEDVEDKMSSHKSDSEISKVNRDAFQQPVVVSEDTFEVIEKSLDYGKLSGGAFDITVGPLIELWKNAANVNIPPTAEQIAQAEDKVGYEKLILDANEHSVRFAVEGMKLDLGGIAKGFGIDKALERIQAANVAGAMVDVGGDIRCFGAGPNGKKYWRIGLQDPTVTDETSMDDEPLLILSFKDAAVTTSGDYRRFVLIDGQRYSHIINRSTGKSAGDLASVTIIAEKAVDADALATTVSVLGAEKGLALIESMPQVEAILIGHSDDQKIIKTSGVEKYIK